jgi:cytochrome c oxidase subunit 1
MLALGYLGMPRRYATYAFDGALAPLAQVTNFHALASAGAIILFVGQLIFVWNFVQSWMEGPTVDDEDPWNLKEEAPTLYGREFQWHEQRLATAIPDGGEESEEAMTDGGTETDADDTAEPADD